jgi:hypothetical protein
MSTPEDMQKECHDAINKLGNKVTDQHTYRDATDVWVFYKIAELENRITQLEVKESVSTTNNITSE